MRPHVCVHQSEPAAISPLVCARSLSFTLTHLSAPACPHDCSNQIQLEDHDSWHRSAPAAPAFNGLVFVCFFLKPFSSGVFFPPHVLIFVTESVTGVAGSRVGRRPQNESEA